MTVRVRMKRHPSGVCVAHIAIPTRVGTITVGGFGDFLSDALNAASKVSHRITSDPVISAILPPQATVALMAVNAIADAANHSPEALKAELDQHSGPGKVRLVKALHAEATALDNGATPAAAARAATAAAKSTTTATADNTSSSSRGLPSFLGDWFSDLNAQVQAKRNRARGVSSDHRQGSLTPAKPSPRRTQSAPSQPSRNHQGRGDDDMAAHNHGHKRPDQRPDDYEDDADAGQGDDGDNGARPQDGDSDAYAPQSSYSPQAYADDVRAQREADERVQRYADAEAQTRAMFGEDGADGE